MSGHSHWSNIQKKKGKTDAKRGAMFTRAAQQIIVAARDGGSDPDHNLSLRIAIEYAKSVNMPKDNILRAAKKGAGEDGASQIQVATYEGYGPSKIPFIISTLTDNPTRTVADLRNIFSKAGGELGSTGAVMWQFTETGLIVVKPAVMKKSEKFGEDDYEVEKDIDEAMLELMDIEGINDISIYSENKNQLAVRVDVVNLSPVSKKIGELGYVILSSGQHYDPNTKVELDEVKSESFASFMDTLEEYPDVQKIWHGAK